MSIRGFGLLILTSYFCNAILQNTNSNVVLAAYGLENDPEERTTTPSPYKDVCSRIFRSSLRPHNVTITSFGAVGDGVTLNTDSFQKAISFVRSVAAEGGAQLYIPAGRWLTGSFNLTSNLTLFLDKDAVVLGSQV
eukprot:c15022_g1_i1 orf=271-678(-)